MITAERLVAAGLVLGEGPVALDGDEYACVDIRRGWILVGDLSGSIRVIRRYAETVSALAVLDDGHLIAAVGNRVEAVTEPDLGVRLPDTAPPLRTNDGKADPAGRFVVGTMADPPELGAGALWSISNGTPRRLLDDVTISNGLCWSRDGHTLFHIDTPTRQIVEFDYDLARGAVGTGRTVVSIAEGLGDPDGMTIDSDGRLWVAMWGGGAVVCFDGGQLVERIDVPTPFVTCPAFVGVDLDQLLITTASEPTGPVPNAGDIYVARPKASGLPTTPLSRVGLFGASA